MYFMVQQVILFSLFLRLPLSIKLLLRMRKRKNHKRNLHFYDSRTVRSVVFSSFLQNQQLFYIASPIRRGTRKKLYVKFPPWLPKSIVLKSIKGGSNETFALNNIHHPLTRAAQAKRYIFDISLMFDIIKSKKDHIKMPIEY